MHLPQEARIRMANWTKENKDKNRNQWNRIKAYIEKMQESCFFEKTNKFIIPYQTYLGK